MKNTLILKLNHWQPSSTLICEKKTGLGFGHPWIVSLPPSFWFLRSLFSRLLLRYFNPLGLMLSPVRGQPPPGPGPGDVSRHPATDILCRWLGVHWLTALCRSCSVSLCYSSPLNVLEDVRPFLKSLASTEIFACLLVCVCCSVGHPVARGRAFYTWTSDISEISHVSSERQGVLCSSCVFLTQTGTLLFSKELCYLLLGTVQEPKLCARGCAPCEGHWLHPWKRDGREEQGHTLPLGNLAQDSICFLG